VVVWTVLLAIGLAWGLQSMFGYLQIKHFNQRFIALRKLGRVVVGRNSGRFRAGTVILIVIDHKHNIVKAEKMQGVTVFSRMRNIEGLKGKNLLHLTREDLSKYDKLTAKAIQDAIHNLNITIKGGEIPTKRTWLDAVLQKKLAKKG
jgi:glucitol operon activator protein